MKFLIAVLIIRFVIARVSNKKDTIQTNDAEAITGRIFHPAEFALR